MAIYHCKVKTISRNQGRSSVASSAYRAREKITNEHDGVIHDYTAMKDIAYKEIMLPEQAPEQFKNRSVLWNEVEKSEKRINSRTAREVELALPKELSQQEQIKLVREYVKENFINKGMCADICIHDKKDGNVHAHIMLTTREVNKNGFTKKNRDWDKKESLEDWRKNWAEVVNKYLEKNQINERIDHRSYKEQGIEKIPTIHLGVEAHQMEKKGIETYKGNINREITERNEILKQNVIEISQLRKLKDSYNKDNDIEKRNEKLLNASKINYAELEFEKINLVEQRENLYQKQLGYRNDLNGINDYNNSLSLLDRTEQNCINELENIRGINTILKYKEIKSLKDDIKKVNEKKSYLEKAFNDRGLNKLSIQGIKNNIKKLDSEIQAINEKLKDISKNQIMSELLYKKTKIVVKLNNEFVNEKKLSDVRVNENTGDSDKKSILMGLKLSEIESKLNKISRDDYKRIYNHLNEPEKKLFDDTIGNKLKQQELLRKEMSRKQERGFER